VSQERRGSGETDDNLLLRMWLTQPVEKRIRNSEEIRVATASSFRSSRASRTLLESICSVGLCVGQQTQALKIGLWHVRLADKRT
jgi:hypothetical protein